MNSPSLCQRGNIIIRLKFVLFDRKVYTLTFLKVLKMNMHSDGYDSHEFDNLFDTDFYHSDEEDSEQNADLLGRSDSLQCTSSTSNADNDNSADVAGNTDAGGSNLARRTHRTSNPKKRLSNEIGNLRLISSI